MGTQLFLAYLDYKAMRADMGVNAVGSLRTYSQWLETSTVAAYIRRKWAAK